MGVVRDFFHEIVDILCDFFKAAWDYMVNVIKAIVRFAGRAVDFFHKLYAGAWDAIKRGTKTIYVFMFGDPDPASTDPEREINNMLGKMIGKAKEEGQINNVPIGITEKEDIMLTVTYDNHTEKVDDRSFKAINVESGVSDPGMADMIAKLKNDKRCIKVGAFS